MRICIDIEANGLNNPDKIWVIVCKDIDTKKIHIFRNVHEEQEKQRFLDFSRQVKTWIGHNILGFDFPVLVELQFDDLHVRRVDGHVDRCAVGLLTLDALDVDAVLLTVHLNDLADLLALVVAAHDLHLFRDERYL